MDKLTRAKTLPPPVLQRPSYKDSDTIPLAMAWMRGEIDNSAAGRGFGNASWRYHFLNALRDAYRQGVISGGTNIPANDVNTVAFTLRNVYHILQPVERVTLFPRLVQQAIFAMQEIYPNYDGRQLRAVDWATFDGTLPDLPPVTVESDDDEQGL